MAPVVELLLSKQEALNSNPSTAKKKERKKTGSQCYNHIDNPLSINLTTQKKQNSLL